MSASDYDARASLKKLPGPLQYVLRVAACAPHIKGLGRAQGLQPFVLAATESR